MAEVFRNAAVELARVDGMAEGIAHMELAPEASEQHAVEELACFYRVRQQACDLVVEPEWQDI